MAISSERIRCSWAESDPLSTVYHDQEWGVPEFDSRALWECLILESFQAGLSWITVLRKRETLRAAFQGFDPQKVARFDENRIAMLLQDPGIIRSRAKISAAIAGAQAFLRIESGTNGFSDWIWSMAGGEPIQNNGPGVSISPLAVTFSKELKQQGFKFVGPVIVYAWMQACGIVNDHAPACFRRGFCARIQRR